MFYQCHCDYKLLFFFTSLGCRFHCSPPSQGNLPYTFSSTMYPARAIYPTHLLPHNKNSPTFHLHKGKANICLIRFPFTVCLFPNTSASCFFRFHFRYISFFLSLSPTFLTLSPTFLSISPFLPHFYLCLSLLLFISPTFLTLSLTSLSISPFLSPIFSQHLNSIVVDGIGHQGYKYI